MNDNIPIFPLKTVLYPGGQLSLRIFEARYVDMVSECLRMNKGFGICLIRHGHEVGEPAEFHQTGTLARIIDWTQQPDGLLGITARGERRFRVLSSHVRANGLIEGTMEMFVEEEPRAVPDEYQPMRDLFNRLARKYGLTPADKGRQPDDAGYLSDRLAEMLPLTLGSKQALLELNDGLARLRQLRIHIDQIGVLGLPG